MSRVLESILKERLKPAVPESFDINKLCFQEQVDFIMDQSPWVVADCSRRSGKSIACSFDLTETCLKTAGINCLYITLTRGTAKKLVWKELINLNLLHNLGGKVNISELTITYPNGSTVFLSGCNTEAEIEKFRGMNFKLIYVDEVQSFKSFIVNLINDVLAPALMDYAGSLKLIGTPAPLKRGFFWECLNNPEYSRHKWTFWNNPHIALKSKKTHDELLNRELKRRGVGVNDASIRREWFGEWVDDANALVCKYSSATNHYDTLPAIITEYVIGVDIGFNDADAIAVVGWNKLDKKCYLVEEVITTKQGITELMNQVSLLINKYNPLKVVMDEGGLGKKIGEELRKRYALPIQAAEKSRKYEFIALLNDAFTTQSFFAKRTSRFAQDSNIMEWDYDKSTPDRMVVKKDPHSDIFDSVLYAYREAMHYFSERPKPIPDLKNNKDAWIEFTRQSMYDRMEIDEATKLAQEHSDDFEAIALLTSETDDHTLAAARYYLDKRNRK